MKKTTIYECNDGTRFDSEKQALEYDALLSKCNSINDVIGHKVGLEYDQYVQRNAETVKKQWRVFCNIVAEYIPDCAQIAKECGNGTRHRSHIGRVIDDYNIKCLYNLYYRFECIDEQGREYQQPYFANGHQSEATREVCNE